MNPARQSPGDAWDMLKSRAYDSYFHQRYTLGDPGLLVYERRQVLFRYRRANLKSVSDL